jgi:mono/diheme cytochrome c family protein
VNEFNGQKATFKGRAAGFVVVACAALVGCQQKMAEQPAPRAYDAYAGGVFANSQSAQPLTRGVVHRGQRPADDPMLTWLTPAGKAPKVNPDWKKAVDPSGDLQATAGAPTDVGNFVAEFPFEMTEADLNRGQQRYNVFCGVCHGAAGNGWGKIVERGFLRPPSYHQDAQDKAFDWSSTGQPSTELKQGYSRGFFRYGIKVPLDQVPVGYIYQVITWGYGGMPDHASQIPPEDRWRIVAYVRALQLSQGAKTDALPADAKKELDDAGKPNAEKKADH